jgi:hypothetical protein
VDNAGGVRPGTGINFNATNGVISVPFGAGINTVVDIPDVYAGGPGNPNLTQGALLIYNSNSSRWQTQTGLDYNDNMDGGEY